jgi:hypothetical protein
MLTRITRLQRSHQWIQAKEGEGIGLTSSPSRADCGAGDLAYGSINVLARDQTPLGCVLATARERRSSRDGADRPTKTRNSRLFTERACRRGCRENIWACRGSGCQGQVCLGIPAAGRPERHPSAVIWWLWSFIRLCVAAMSRHSDSTADLPRRWNRVMRRLNLICPNTGSIVDLRSL